MPTYDFRCTKCKKDHAIIRSMSEYTSDEPCPKCRSRMERIFTPDVYFMGTKIENAEYNPALGVVTKSKRHREELAKRKGLVEIGNDYKSGKTMDKAFESERKKKRERSWEDV